jgi:hypothetical protein
VEEIEERARLAKDLSKEDKEKAKESKANAEKAGW